MRAVRLASALMAAAITLAPLAVARAQIGLGVTITIAPPMLPVYLQPPMPGIGYIWTPGYWAYGDAAYYWVPGVWVEPPGVGLYWTPGYWGWSGGIYRFSAGYWGPQVGYYGGINYGYGYGGSGYQGGEWRGRDFHYNQSNNNFGAVHVTHIYEGPATQHQGEAPSFNGPHGTQARPNPREEQAGRLGHVQPTAQQERHGQAAAQDHAARAPGNGGHPAPGSAPQREVQPQHQQAPQREAPPQHQQAPQREVPPQHQQAPQREAPPQHQQAPQREAPPQRQQGPTREEERR